MMKREKYREDGERKIKEGNIEKAIYVDKKRGT